MHTSKLTRITTVSLLMSKLSLLIIFAVMVINVLSWLKPKFILEEYGLELALTGRALSHFDIEVFSTWKLIGGILISTIPLLSLAGSFWAFYRLFGNYKKGDYFSRITVKYLEYAGWGVILWSLLDIFCEPLLMLWLTLSAPVGERLISLSFTSSHFVAIFIAVCMAIISRILYQACDIYEENQSIL
ncbi:putative membrane protein [Xenorhabdus poinarii G6]|uniref:Putative membrane protein n=1 Tax=Xenorhabdus poinarii G6 TaxID=1354304 RepID=A0A068R1L0_9GAMM|nr:DUF2975 domain-containing protein [Xenorhabdus poinarii]CDG20756.1 putative membrane protein [Xenorhabdus poinarii G6]